MSGTPLKSVNPSPFQFRLLGHFIVLCFILRFISFSFIRFKKSFYHFWFLEFFTYQKAWFWIFRTPNQTKVFMIRHENELLCMSHAAWRHCSKCRKISYVNWAVLYWVCFEDLNFIPIYLLLVKIGFFTDVTFVTCPQSFQNFHKVLLKLKIWLV